MAKGIEVYTKNHKTYVDVYTRIWRVIQAVFNLLILSFVIYIFHEAWILVSIAVIVGLFELFVVLKSETIILDADQIVITKQIVFIKYFEKAIDYHEIGNVFIRKKERSEWNASKRGFRFDEYIYSVCITQKRICYEIGAGINEIEGRKMIENVFDNGQY